MNHLLHERRDLVEIGYIHGRAVGFHTVGLRDLRRRRLRFADEPAEFTVRIDLRRVAAIKSSEEILRNRTRIKVVKNKLAPPFRLAEFDIMFGEGISREGSLLDVAVEEGIVRKAGAWFTYENDQLGQGREKAKLFLRENPEIAMQLQDKVFRAVGLIGGDEDDEQVEVDKETGEILGRGEGDA